ncbi:hypothetical protein [Motiliproteus sp. MSK22-1]|uniref:hypothetical protein n=1 Tax=Motiliproteus sp. MSK22-1 TaxID=1897630 RepID=UPI0009779185|nr:hypothetical protein [Motiliproteus sp. MSK22-1]OMH33564.1 hypothetical protein BGP75_11060 [Motiliproteus sp. MSK22-1]
MVNQLIKALPRCFKGLFVLVPVILLSSPFVFAHNVVGGVYALGSLIEGEAGFSNGDMAKPGTAVKILDSNGALIAETSTDEEGIFSYQATRRIDHHFLLDLSSGHVLKLVLPADELPENLSSEAKSVAQTAVPSVDKTLSGSDARIDSEKLQQMIEKAVAKQVKPLRKELSAYKEKASLQDVLGGLGYIFGLCGIGIWIRQRKQEQDLKDKQRQEQARATVS